MGRGADLLLAWQVPPVGLDYERKSEHHQAWVQWAMVRVMVKRLAPQAPPQPTRTLNLAA